MHRRDFLEGCAALVIVPMVAACSEDIEGGGGTCDGAGADTSVHGSHRHYVCVPLADLETVPAAAVTYVSSRDDGHTHSVTLTPAQLEQVAGGGSVALTTTRDDGHTHSVRLQRA